MENIEETIHDNATDDQMEAIDHIGSHAKLLAGPGTGKTFTLTHRVLSLILKHGVKPNEILLLAFTRLAVAQLKEEIEETLTPIGKEIPQISTLHSFALEQIRHNLNNNVGTLPRPLRIADEWERKNIVQEDLRKTLGRKSIGIEDVKEQFKKLQADWPLLETDGKEQERLKTEFLTELEIHRKLYGETLLTELNYQLKKHLGQDNGFKLNKEYKHILIDEYQDLNPCELTIIGELARRGAELFATGDDDQSIYGFRFADPDGIRNFTDSYPDAKNLTLKTCFRCDKEIFKLAEFVANQDADRELREWQTAPKARDGKVSIEGSANQDGEAQSITRNINHIVSSGTALDKIAILLRNNKNNTVSEPITKALEKEGIEFSLATKFKLGDTKEYRTILSILRLLDNPSDSLAWRTLIKVNGKGLGVKCIEEIENCAKRKGQRFGEVLKNIDTIHCELLRFGTRIFDYASTINKEIYKYSLDKSLLNENLFETVMEIIDKFVTDETIKEQIKEYFIGNLQNLEEETLNNLITALNIQTTISKDELTEEEANQDAIKILTMHQAKGLTFDICFIAGAEDESIPGPDKKNEGDERRLLYVSITRAKHKLFISYCKKKTGRHQYTRGMHEIESRKLTRFLENSEFNKRQ